MKLAYEHSMTQPLGASHMPGNVIREDRTSAGMRPGFPGDSGASFTGGAFNETRPAMTSGERSYLAGASAARDHFGLNKGASLTQPGTPKTNVDATTQAKPNAPRVPDAGTGYATSGAQYGADIRR